MSIIRTGPGLKMYKKQMWFEGEEETIYEISLDGIKDICEQPSLYYEPEKIAQPGDILMINEKGSAEWTNPMEKFNDKDLREAYPPLEDAWQTLLIALQEYELTKKLVQDHDG